MEDELLEIRNTDVPSENWKKNYVKMMKYVYMYIHIFVPEKGRRHS